MIVEPAELVPQAICAMPSAIVFDAELMTISSHRVESKDVPGKFPKTTGIVGPDFRTPKCET